jgi:pilus assembly protein CpaB
MGATRIIVLAVAAVAAIGLAFMVRTMATPPKPAAVAATAPAPIAKPTARVLVAKADLQVGQRIEKSDLAWQDWPVEAINPAFITDGAPPPAAAPVKADAPAKEGMKTPAVLEPVMASISGSGAMDAITGAVVREPILANQPILERQIVRDGQGGYMAVVLQPGMRAMAIPVTVDTGAGGFILPGDRVDVIQSRRVDKAAGQSGGPDVVSQVVMRNLRVLAVDQTTQVDKKATSVVGATVTLEVPAGDAAVLARAKTGGDLALALRSYADAAAPVGRAMDAEDANRVFIHRAGQVQQVMVP